MAKVMISIPNPLLERIDAHAKSQGETRSGFIQRVAEDAIVEDRAHLRRELEELLGPPVPMGGNAAQLIREDRDSH